MKEKLIILIPAYEPTTKLLDLLKKLKKENLTTIIVNDGSNNTYDEIFNEAKKYAYILKHDANKGKGRALKTGIEYIQKNFNKDYVIITDEQR